MVGNRVLRGGCLRRQYCKQKDGVSHVVCSLGGWGAEAYSIRAPASLRWFAQVPMPSLLSVGKSVGLTTSTAMGRCPPEHRAKRARRRIVQAALRKEDLPRRAPPDTFPAGGACKHPSRYTTIRTRRRPMKTDRRTFLKAGAALLASGAVLRTAEDSCRAMPTLCCRALRHSNVPGVVALATDRNGVIYEGGFSASTVNPPG